jgi:hypothetical protein
LPDRAVDNKQKEELTEDVVLPGGDIQIKKGGERGSVELGQRKISKNQLDQTEDQHTRDDRITHIVSPSKLPTKDCYKLADELGVPIIYVMDLLPKAKNEPNAPKKQEEPKNKRGRRIYDLEMPLISYTGSLFPEIPKF